MLEDQDFAFGHQWSKNDNDQRYKANLALRLVAQKTAFLYAKNPNAVARRRERMNATIWDENQSSLQSLMQSGAQMIQQAQMTGSGMTPEMMGAAQNAMAVMQDAARVKQENAMLDKLGKTLELLYSYNVSDQPHPFKSMMKLVVRRTITTGVGFVKLGFERVMGQRPDMEKGIADANEKLATLERLAADMADDVTDPDSKEAEQLRLMINDMAQQTEFVAREGLTFDYPLPTNIIPDVKTIELRNFLGADWVAEQFLMTPNDIEEVYGVDVGTTYTSYSRADMKGPDPIQMAREMTAGYEWREGGKAADRQTDFCSVWQIYCRKDGLVYEVCDGYSDFLREPAGAGNL